MKTAATKTVIIHIGLHKTGSTSIQNFLKVNRLKLPVRMALFNQADQTSRDLRQACQGYQAACQKGWDAASRREMILRACQKILSDCTDDVTTILISDEEIAGIMPGRLGNFRMYPQLPEIARALVEGFAPHKVVFVVYTRESRAWIRSVHNQAVKQHRLKATFGAFQKAVPDALDLDGQVQRLQDAVGAEAVHALSFEREARAPHGLNGALLRIAGLQEAEIALLDHDVQVSNQSLHPTALELTRRLNHTAIEASQLAIVTTTFLQHAALFDSAPPGPLADSPPPRRPPEVAVPVHSAYYINLDFRQDRRAHMEKLLQNCPWPVERVPGVLIDQDPEALGLVMRPTRKKMRGVAGIWLAHKKCLQRALETEGPGAVLLLEDDLLLSDDFLNRGLSVPGPLPANWQILLLSPRFKVGNDRFLPLSLNRPTLLRSLPFISTGAHFTIFRNQTVVRSALQALDTAVGITDVDHFYVDNLMTYGVSSPKVSAGGFGSDHSSLDTA